MIVAQILKSKPGSALITITQSARISEAAALLSEKKIGALIVSETGETAEGILSERDIVREVGRRGAGCLDNPVADLMTGNPVTCSLDTTIDKIMADMTSGRFRHMPVTDGPKLIGLISIGDVVKARMDELAHEKEALQDMIMGR